MSRWDESLEDRWERRREERRQFEGDVAYEVWRAGYNPDRARDCAYDCYDAGRTAHECAYDFIACEERQRAERRAAEEEAEYQQYLEEQYAREDAEWLAEIEAAIAAEQMREERPAQRSDS